MGSKREDLLARSHTMDLGCHLLVRCGVGLHVFRLRSFRGKYSYYPCRHLHFRWSIDKPHHCLYQGGRHFNLCFFDHDDLQADDHDREADDHDREVYDHYGKAGYHFLTTKHHYDSSTDYHHQAFNDHHRRRCHSRRQHSQLLLPAILPHHQGG